MQLLPIHQGAVYGRWSKRGKRGNTQKKVALFQLSLPWPPSKQGDKLAGDCQCSLPMS